jgi:putative tryptophan/tyrosine transport system substrate-binding protein
MMTARRQAIAMLGTLLCGAALTAPVEGKIYRIGVLTFQYPKDKNQALPALAKLGYIEGHNVVLDYRYCELDLVKLDAMAAELAALNLDLIIAPMDPDVRAASRHTKTTPIVTTYAMSPVDSGLIQSYVHPGGNITGTTWWEPPTAVRVISLIHELAPKVRRIADLGIFSSGYVRYRDARSKAAQALGMELVSMIVTNKAELAVALERIRKEKIDAIFSAEHGVLEVMRPAILEVANKLRILTFAPTKAAVEAGFVMGYFPNDQELFKRTAIIMDRVLQGESPANIPVEQPMRLTTMVNLTAARSIGLSVPQSILLQATEIIQ